MRGMDELKKISYSINDITDIDKYLSDTDDGESGIIEFKEVDELSDKGKKANFRAKIAKEMCAFANSEGGILVVGVKVENGKVVLGCEEPNLENFLEKQKISMYLEPSLKGLDFKSLDVTDGCNKPVIIMIPKSDFLPHRTINHYKHVTGENKDIVGEYFVREGSDSRKLSEQLVRAMYLSSGRAPHFEIKPVVRYSFEGEETGRSKIEIEFIVTPDKIRFIKDYYWGAQINFYNDRFEEIPIEDNQSKPIFKASDPIYPSDTDYSFGDKIYIKPSIPLIQSNGCVAVSPRQNMSYTDFSRIKFMIINIKYACEGMQLVDEIFYFVVFQTPYDTPDGGVRFIESENYHNIYVDERCLSQDKILLRSGHSEDYIDQQCTISVEQLAKKYSIPKK